MSILQHMRQLTFKQVYALLIVCGTLALMFTVVTTSKEVGDQPGEPKAIKFSHTLHVETAGLECSTCHDAAATSMASSDNLLAKKAKIGRAHV